MLAHYRQLDEGTTHWEGCEAEHPRCLAYKLVERVRELEWRVERAEAVDRIRDGRRKAGER